MGWLQRQGYLLGTSSLALFILGGYLALFWSPPDMYQGNAMRILYVHVPTIVVAYIAFFLVLVASALYLWKRDWKWDRLAAACAELGVLFTAITLAVGSVWAKPIWGVWWTWDPRLTTTAILFVIYAGYLMLRTLQPDPIARAKQSAIVGIVGFVDIPIVHYSVSWWHSLHQSNLNLTTDPTLDDRMEVALLVNMLAFLVFFLFLLGQRLRLAGLEQRRDEFLWEEAQRV
ncbi:MAG TPA: cytochrome c biogenesis protein CcsA [Chloroflexota bacterium]|nr:cytochrome c biogenesis protein CcsA [Chloroflexota bacterium]